MFRFVVARLGPLASFLAIWSASVAARAQAPARVTLDEAVARALAQNPTVAVALAEIDRADALIRQARAASYPSLVGNAAYTRLEGDRFSAPGVKIASQDQIAINLLLTVPLFAPVAWAQTRHADDNRRIADASAADVRRQLAVAAARAYLAVVAQHRVITANENARNTAQAHYDYAHTRLAGGIGRSIDEVRAEQELRANEVAIEGAYAGLARAREALGVLLAAEGSVDTRDEVALAAPPSLESALGDARARRSDVKALETRLHAGEQLARDDWVYYAPILSAAAQPFFQDGLPLQPRAGWQAQLILTLPLYDGGQRAGIARERDALVVEARASLDAAVRQARSDVRTAFDAVVHADRALVAARAAAALARRALELATLAYRAGATSNLEVIDASRASRAADTAAVQAEDLARQGRLDLLAASGRFP
ncbi:MAG TPA: TolC family protein [Polyangia bacterium]|nr:TolC family protein [Polyangia bacterium]